MNVEQLISKVQCWPNNDQMLLLKAALNNDNSAIEAWKQWSSKVDLEDTDNGSYRLYPLVYRNLTDLNIDANLIPKTIKGVYRYYWSYSNRLFLKVSSIINILNSYKIPVLLLKGAPLSINFYPNIATRPLRDIDIMIHYEHLDKTIKTLNNNGFYTNKVIKKNTFNFIHAISFKDKNSFEIDLHLSVISENLDKKSQMTYWENSEITTFFGHKTLTLCPTDHLFHTIVHGVKNNGIFSSIRWIVDSKMIINNSFIDWSRIVTLANKNKVSIKVLVALKYLKLHFIDNIPEEVFEKLIKIPSKYIEKIEFIEKTKKNNGKKILLFNYLRVKNNSSFSFPFSFIIYLKIIFDLKSSMKIPFFIFKRMIQIPYR